MSFKGPLSLCPCDDCITYAICRSYLLDQLSKYQNFTIATVLSHSFVKELSNKCSLIKNYMNFRTNLIEITNEMVYFDVEVAKILIEIFKLRSHESAKNSK